MKAIKLLLFIMVATLLTFGISGNGFAFHGGGVAHCDGCHTMHNSLNGVQNTIGGVGSVGTGVNDLLLKSANKSDVCLNCHFDEDLEGGYHVFSSDGSDFTPGGDFYWMTKTFNWTAHNEPYESNKDDHGHNVITSFGGGIAADATLSHSPGGNFPSAFLACSSCHNPHGTKAEKNGPITESGSYGAQPDLAAGTDVGNYRLLADIGYTPDGAPGQFLAPAPKARAASFFSGPYVESDTKHTDYGTGMSEFCGNCHGDFMSESNTSFRHPASSTATIASHEATNYNTYVKTGDMSSMSWPSGGPFLALVPFERGAGVSTADLDPTTNLGVGQGPSGSGNVMCLTCHRAHASAFQNVGRWDFSTELIADSHPASTDQGVTGDDVTNSYYTRNTVAQFGEYQRSFCNKCHAQD